MVKKSIDVSDNQGVIDWLQVKLSGIEFVILRSVRGSGKTDYQFVSNVTGCATNRIMFSVYKYSYATDEAETINEAKQVIALLKKYGIKCKVWWDIEDPSLRILGKEVLTHLLKIANETITNAGYEFGVYCNLDWYKNVINGKTLPYKFWIARYPSDKEIDLSYVPNEKYKPEIVQELSGWQHSSHGKVPGINGYVDMDELYETEGMHMAVLIGHASIDENGKAKGGKAGDQTRKEICVRNWYNKPWTHVIRFRDSVMAEKVAYAMEQACINDNIGYDQNQRNTLLTYARKVGYDPARVGYKCETDCSALVSLCCMYAGVKEEELYRSGNSSVTSNLRSRLNDTGLVDIHTESTYIKDDDYLKRGDILLDEEGHHVAVVLSNGTKIGVGDVCPYKEPTSSLHEKDSNEGVQWMKWHLNRLIKMGLIKATKLTETNKNWLSTTSATFKAFQIVYPETGTNGKPDGSCGPKAIKKLKSLV